MLHYALIPILVLNILASLFWPGQSDSWQWHSPSLNQNISTSSTTFRVYLPVISQPAASEFLTLINQLRTQNGCGPLTLSSVLSAAANTHSADMAANNFVGHNGTDGSTLDERLDEAGYAYRLAAENVAAGYATPQAVVLAWYNETPPNDGHRRNILNCDLKETGIGQAYNPDSTYRFYWTQDFGTQ